MRSAGRPPSPTLHPRTKPEATENATKNRQTQDWFRHDGKNVENEPIPPARLQGHKAEEIAEKNKGHPDDWFQHHATESPEEHAPKSRIHSEEAKKVQEKVAGTEEHWFKFEENKDYHTPRPKSRVTSQQGEEVLNKLGRADTMDWYRHQHGGAEDQGTQPPKGRTGPLPYVDENKKKLHPADAPEWYEHPPNKPEEVGAGDFSPAPFSRVTTTEANDYRTRSQAGSASNWFGHDGTVTDTPQGSARGTPRTKEIHGKMKKESEDWFSHDPAQDYSDTQQHGGRGGGSFAKEMVAKSRGGEMDNIMHGNSSTASPAGGRAIKPEAEDNAQKNRQGMMSKYLDFEANQEYQSARAGGRVVKQEALDNAARNKGCMSDVMGGYPPAGPGFHDKRRIRPEGEAAALRNQGTSGLLSHSSAVEQPRASRMTSDAARYKERNQGTMSQIMGGVDQMAVGDRPVPRLQTDTARMAAERNRGTVGLLQ